jgi:O-antigen/teichoic acid export membrane protein
VGVRSYEAPVGEDQPPQLRIGRSALGVFGSNLVNLVLSFGNSIVLTRALGVVGRGEFAIFSASFGILSLLLGLGLDVALRYYVAKGRLPRERILTALLLFAATAGSFVCGVVHLNHRLFRNEFFLPFSKQCVPFELTLGGVVAANLIYGNISSVFAGARSFRALNLSSIGFGALSALVYGGLMWAKVSGKWRVGSDEIFVTYLALALFNAAVLSALAYRMLGVRFSLHLVSGALLKDMVRYAGLAYAGMLAQFLNYRADIWIVQYFCGSAALGLYSLAANLAMMLWVLPRATSTVLFPVMATARATQGFQDAARLARLVFAATLALAVPLSLLARWWITLFYGAAFAGSSLPFVILLLGCVPFALCVVQAAAVAGVNRLDVNVISSTLGLVATVVLDLILIPRFGILGAAVASAASYLVTALVVLRAFARLGGLRLAACVVPDAGDLRYVRDGLGALVRWAREGSA